MANKLRELFCPETKWFDKRITDNNPCYTCDIHKNWLNRAIYGNPAEREDAVINTPQECMNCLKHMLWISECLCKLRWYENNDERLKTVIKGD